MRLAASLFLCSLFCAAFGDFSQGEEVILEKDIIYSQANGKPLLLDLAQPKATDSPRPALVFIHGGGWQFGDRNMYLDDIETAAGKGYVAVTVSYRLTDPDESGRARTPFPAQIEDVKAAVRWLRENAAKYHVDPDRIGAIGASAGGHLSLLLGVTEASDDLEGSNARKEVSSRVQAVVNFYGPTDLTRLYATSPKAGKLAATLLGGPPAGRERAYERASPITYVSGDDPPMLTIHGRQDKLVPIEQAVRFDQVMHKAGAAHTLLILEDAEHGFKGNDASQAQAAAFYFFDKHLQPK
jgi:acetyl esterase/lipase